LFFEALDRILQKLIKKGTKAIIMDDINIDLSFTTTTAHQNDYWHILMILKPTLEMPEQAQ